MPRNPPLHRPANNGFYNSVIRRITATFLLLCMALMVPASASSVRVCFIDLAVLLPGWTATQAADSEKPECCPDCDGEENDNCCLDVEKLPDAPMPHHLVVPPALFVELHAGLEFPPCRGTEIARPFAPSAPIRGPDSPREWRALIGIWNI